MDQKTAAKPMPRPSLERMLATVPSHSQQILDEKVNDTHLAEIARALTDWKSVCTMLGISEADEAAIKEENETTDARRLAVLRRWRSKYGPHATYKSLANLFYCAEKLDMVEVVCQALEAPSNSAIQQQEGILSITMEVNVLCEELSAVSDWYQLGLKLGVPDYKLDEIQRKHSSSRWKMEMLKLWLQLNPNASWMNIVRALQRMTENTLAKMIRQKYMRRGSSPSPPTTPLFSHPPPPPMAPRTHQPIPAHLSEDVPTEMVYDTPLGHEQLSEITAYLVTLNRNDVINLGLVLGIWFTTLVNLPNENFINHMLCLWLQEADSVGSKGKPSWKSIVLGLRDKQVRQNGIANTIAKDHCITGLQKVHGFVPPSGTPQVGGQFVGAVIPPQLSTGGEQSVIAPSQPLKQGTLSVTMEINVLCEELSAVSDWYQLGLKLCVPDYKLDEIQRNHSSSRWKIEMLKLWLQLNPNASWINVVRALQRMEENTLAKMIRQKYMRKGSSPSPPTSPGPLFSHPPPPPVAPHTYQPTPAHLRFVPPSGTSQVSGQFVGAMNPSQHSTGGEQSLVAPSQHLQQGDAYHSYCSNVRTVYQRGPFQKEDCWPPMQKVKYINLAILKSDKLTFSDDYTLMTIQRSADDIVSKKKKIGYNELFDGLDSGVRILVEGRPGCGKTTLMNKVSLDWAKKIILKEIELLLLVPLRRFHKKQEVKLDDILRLYDTGHLYNAVGAEVSKSGGQGLCVVFDGIDEYPQSSVSGSFVLDVLAGRLLPNSVVIASSRPAAAHDIRKYATQRVEVLGFLRPDIQQYIQEYYDGKDDEVKNLSSYLEHHPNIRHMCYLPLHLAMIVYLNDILPTKSLPHTETDVYSNFMFHTLLHDLHRSDNTCSKLSNINQLPVESQKIFQNICRLAYIATDQSEQIFTRDQIQEHIGSREFNLKSLSLLTEDRLLAEQGLEETYSFAHLTFQEFLAAYHLTELPDAEQLKTAEEHGGDRTMIMVWRFYCGLTKLSGETPKKVFQAILKQHEINTLLLSHGVHESQNESACHELLSSRSGVLSISDEVITPADSLAVSYCMKNAVTLLEEVSLDSCYLGDDELRVLTSGCSVPLTNVKCLRLRSTVVRKKAVSSFAALLEKFPSLESFEFTKCSRLPSNEDFIRLFSSLINLKSFTTDIGFIRMGGIQQFLTKFQHLEHMKCHGSKLTLEMTLGFGKATLARVVRVKRNQESEVANVQSDLDSYDVKLFDMGTLYEGDAYVIAVLLQMYPGAQSIDAIGCHLTKNVIGILAEGMKYADMKKLSLSINGIGHDECKALTAVLQQCKQLQVLSLSYDLIGSKNAIGDKELSVLATGLKECQNLKELRFCSYRIGQEGCSALTAVLQQCKQLQVLSLACNKIWDEGLSRGLKACQNLNKLKLGSNKIGEKGVSRLLNGLKECQSIKELDLSNNAICDKEVSILVNGLKECQSLKELNLHSNRIGDAGCTSLSAALQECKELQQLRLDSNNIGDAGCATLSAALQECKQLKQLDLCSNGIGQEGCSALTTGLQQCKELQVLRLGVNKVGDEGLSILANGLKECQSLKNLYLHSNKIGDAGCTSLSAALQECKELQQLRLDTNNIGDAGCATLSATLQECKELKQLDLDWNKLTDASIEPLTSLIKTAKSLTTLRLWNNKFTPDGKKQLRQAAEERKSYPDFVELNLRV